MDPKNVAGMGAQSELSKVVPSLPATISKEEARRAFEKARPWIRALQTDELTALNVDMGRAVAIVLAAEPRIQTLVPTIQKELPAFDVNLVHSLREIALAAWCVHEMMSPPALDSGASRRLFKNAVTTRRALLLQAGALADRGLLDTERVAGIREKRSRADLPGVLLALVELFRASWDSIKLKTPVVDDELARATDLAERLREMLSARERARTLSDECGAGALRARAFSLLARNYDQVRRAISYLRWSARDQDEIAPSIYTGSRGGRRNRS